jgi:predicted flap endonuclease-1-like 5' DNA nuclease
VGWFITQSLLFILLPFVLGAILGYLWWRMQHRKAKFSESSVVRTLSSQHEGQIKERDDLIAKLRSDNKKLTDDAGAARTQIQGLASTRDADIAKSEGELTKARARIAELEKATGRIPELEKANARIPELEKAAGRLGELDAAKARIAELEATAGKAGQIEGDFGRLQAAHTRLEADYEAATGRAGDLAARAEAAEAEVERLRAELAAAPAATGIQGFMTKTSGGEDDLEIIEGVGPKFAAALRGDGLSTFNQIANADESRLRGALTKAGLSFAPSLPTWPQQARYLADGDEQNFRAYVQYLTAGREEGTGSGGIQGLSGADVADDRDDDLERIEGIGPRFASALRAAGIRSFNRLSTSSSDELRNAIEAAGLSFAPSLTTWAEQASLLASGDEAGFKALTDKLVAGRDSGGAQ